MMRRMACKALITPHAVLQHMTNCEICRNRDLSDVNIPHRKLYYSQRLASGKKQEYSGEQDQTEVFNENEANLIASETLKGTHAPVIDLDFPVRLLESKTPGHFHLYLDVELSYEDHFKLLKTLADIGLVEQGYYEASLNKGASFVRTQEMAIRDTLGK